MSPCVPLYLSRSSVTISMCKNKSDLLCNPLPLTSSIIILVYFYVPLPTRESLLSVRGQSLFFCASLTRVCSPIIQFRKQSSWSREWSLPNLAPRVFVPYDAGLTKRATSESSVTGSILIGLKDITNVRK